MSSVPTLVGRSRWLVPATLGFSFLANDGEEWFTMVPTLGETLSRLPTGLPHPRWLDDVDQTHARVGIAFMGRPEVARTLARWYQRLGA